jgi:arylsulfatase A-like enzyme
LNDEKPRFHPLDVLMVGLWSGLVFGLIEVGIVRLQLLGSKKFTFMSPDFPWMTPVADTILLLAGGVLVLILAWLARGHIGWRVVIWTYGFLAVISILYRFPSVDRRACALLAAGVALQLSRWIAPRMPSFGRMVRRTLPWVVALVVAIGGGRHALMAWQERRGLAALPEADSGAPNVLLIILDTVRSLDLSVYGYDRPTTPFLERFAARSVVFDHALTNAPWTLPSHASIFTGRIPHQHSADWLSPLDRTHPVVAEAFAAHGYATAGFVGNKLYCGREKGLGRGFLHYADFMVSPGELIRSTSLGGRYLEERWFRRLFQSWDLPGRKVGARINQEFLSWLKKHPERPFFVFLNYYDAHMPLVPVAPFDTLFSRRGAETRAKIEQMLEASYAGKKPSGELLDVRHEAYDATIAYLDQQLEELLGALEQRGELDRTVVVITSDHGDLFGEKGATGHGDDLFRPALEVPLLVSYPPKVPRGRRVNTAVSLQDLSATMLSLAGITKHPIPGRSLERFWGDSPPPGPTGGDTLVMELSYNKRLPKNTPVAKGAMASIVLDRHRLVRNGDGSVELYDFLNDPEETTDLSQAPEFAEVLTRLQAALQVVAGPPTGRGPSYRGPPALAGP